MQLMTLCYEHATLYGFYDVSPSHRFLSFRRTDIAFRIERCLIARRSIANFQSFRGSSLWTSLRRDRLDSPAQRRHGG